MFAMFAQTSAILVVILATRVFAGPPACLDRCFNVTCGGVNGFIGSVPEPLTISNGTLWTDCMCMGYDLSGTGADGFGPDSGIGRCAGDVCSGVNNTAAQNWVSSNFCRQMSNQQIPFNWTVRSQDPTRGDCAKAITTTYVVTTLVEALLHAIFGYQFVSKRTSTSWKWSWIRSTGLVFASNAVAAYMIKKTPGYGSDFAVWEYMLFLITRPRLAWIVGAFLSPVVRVTTVDNKEVEYHPWQAWFFPAFISEIILMLPTAYFMGLTVYFGAKNRYYSVSPIATASLPGHPMLFYGGALYWLVTAVILIPAGIAASFALVEFKSQEITTPARAAYVRETHYSRHRTPRTQEVKKSTWWFRVPFAAKVTFFMIPSTWLATWLWNVGLFNLEGPLYCPPKLAETGIIWTVFSTLSVILGSLPFGKIFGKNQENLDEQRSVQEVAPPAPPAMEEPETPEWIQVDAARNRWVRRSTSRDRPRQSPYV